MSTTTSRRAILAGAAVLSSLAAPAALASPDHPDDPIFNAIDAHRAANAEHERCVGVADVVPRNNAPAGAEEALDAASDAEYGAMIDLLNTQPTTLAGLAALARYVEAHGQDNWMDVQDDGSWTKFGDCLLSSMADALDAIGQVQS